ncbi:MAG: glycosyltransferase [Bacteroidales bacterium]|nr:glycosyltransferase [Bacteroidales bacterium]
MNPIVSVVVVTYNSSKFVIETLDSIASQTWIKLELIVTDDCSKDNTVELCSAWITKHRERFVRVELITVLKNTGIAANCNRGLNAASGDWIKYCAGDDALLPECVERNMAFIVDNPEIKILFSYARIYSEIFEESHFLKRIPALLPKNIINDEISALGQYRKLLLSDRINFTPSSFIHRQTQLDVGGFNEQVKLQEDYPMWLSLTKAGYKMYFMETETVMYRQHDQATNNMTIDYLIKPNYFRTESFRREYIYPNLPWDIRYEQRFIWYASQLFRSNGLNRNLPLNRILFDIFTVLFNPFKYYLYIKKRVIKEPENQEFYV